MPEMDRKLRQVAQLRALWRAFREPQERREDEQLSRSIILNRPPLLQVQEPTAAYGIPEIRGAIRWWWCERDYRAIVEFGEQLDVSLFEAEPLIRVYIEEAREREGKKRQG